MAGGQYLAPVPPHGTVLFNIFINDLADVAEYILCRFTDDRKLGRSGWYIQGSHCHTEGLQQAREMSWQRLMKFNKKSQVLHLGKNNPRHQCTSVPSWKATGKKRTWGTVAQQMEHKPATCPCSKIDLSCRPGE